MTPASRSFVLAVLLSASIGLKVTMLVQQPSETAASTLVTSKAAVAQWLTRNGFTQVDQGEPDSPFISASAGRCEATIVIAHPAGFHRAIVRRTAHHADERFFFYRGRSYADQPVWRTWLDHQLVQRAHDIGIAVPRRPLFAVMGSACDLRSLSWSEAERLATT